MPKDLPAAPDSTKSRYWRQPLDAEKVKVPHGELHIIVNRCKGCMFCVEYCPRDTLRMSEDFNVKGYHYPDVVDEASCVNCRLCEMLCPEFAIFCLEKDDERGDK
jgi:2-oxoglutarate ferredoxin oxidoreductase subunit delta